MSKYFLTPVEPLNSFSNVPNYIEHKKILLQESNKRIWTQYNNEEKYLSIDKSSDYNISGKEIKNVIEKNDCIFLELFEYHFPNNFLCLYFSRKPGLSSQKSIDMMWSAIDRDIFIGKTLSRVQISGQTKKEYNCEVNERVIWFDFKGGSTYCITVSPKNLSEKMEDFQCNYKIADNTNIDILV
jgi:hypothetical protein